MAMSTSAKLPETSMLTPSLSLSLWSAIGELVGASLTGLTVIVTVAVAVPPLPSLIL